LLSSTSLGDAVAGVGDQSGSDQRQPRTKRDGEQRNCSNTRRSYVWCSVVAAMDLRLGGGASMASDQAPPLIQGATKVLRQPSAAWAVQRFTPSPTPWQPWCRQRHLRQKEASIAGEHCFFVVVNEEQQQQEADDK
ncbi:unnamed protein product, partial [Urochloa humidicola]